MLLFILPVHDQLQLQLLEPHDAEALVTLITAEHRHLKQWLGWLEEVPSLEQQRAFIAQSLQQFASGEALVTGIRYAGVLCGVISVNRFDHQTKTATLGYWLSERYTGQGIMTDAVRAMMSLCFFERAMQVVEIRVAQHNVKSRMVAKRLGFTEAETVPAAENLYGRFVDHVVYRMTREAYNHG